MITTARFPQGKITKFVPTTLTLGGAGDDDDGEKHGMSGIADYKARILGQMQELKG